MPEKSQASVQFPSLRAALWLYLLVLIGTAALTLSLATNIEPLFLRFVAALFIVGGFTLAAIFLQRLKLHDLVGRAPGPISLIVSVLAGVAIWFPFYWLSFMVYRFLENTVGPFPPRLVTESSQVTYILQYGIIIPLFQGLLFWGFIQHAAGQSNRFRGAILTALLFAGYGLFSTDLASSAIPALVLVGLMAAFTVYFTDSIWYAIGITAGYNLGLPLLLNPLLNSYFLVTVSDDQYQNLFSVRWLLLVIVMSFIAFILLQFIRLRVPLDPAQLPSTSRTLRLWWIPLLLSVVLLGAIVTSEMTLRSRNKQVAQVNTAVNGGSTSLPLAQPTPSISQTP
ncbi:MAG: CPBP family glutamic-type intramembrane protease [Chloroflexota bacterium]